MNKKYKHKLDSDFIEALRECLGLSPLYGEKEKKGPNWKSWPINDGNRKVGSSEL